MVCLMAKEKKSLLKFSPVFGVKSKVVEIESRNLSLPFFSVSLYSPPDLFLLCCSFGVWRLEGP